MKVLNSVKHVFKAIFNYYLMSSLIGAFFSFVVIIFLSHNLDTKSFVAVGVFSGLLGVMPSIIGMHTRSYFLIEGVKSKYLSKNDVLNLVSCFFWMMASLMLLYVIGELFSFSGLFSVDLWGLLVITAFLQWLYYTVLVVAQSKNSARMYFIIVLVSSFLGALFVFIKWRVAGLHWEDRVYGLWLGFGVSFVVFSFIIRNEISTLYGWTFDELVTSVFDSIKYSIFLVPFSLSVTAVAFFDRYIVSEYVGVDTAAQYISMSQFVLVYAIFSDSIYKRITPVYLRGGKVRVLILALLSSLVAGVVFLVVGSVAFDLVFPERITFDFSLYLLMLTAAFSVFFVKVVSLLFNYIKLNAHLSIYAVLFNALCVFNMFLCVSYFEMDVLIIPTVIVLSNLLMATTLLVLYEGKISD